jgi:hypothetical protein
LFLRLALKRGGLEESEREVKMSYTSINFRKKRELVDAVKAGRRITCFQPGLGPDLTSYTGRVTLEGPHYPAAHTWYAEGEMVDGILVKVK